MSCWVVPTIAADLWKVSLDQVLAAATSGQVPLKIVEGFVFVDVAPDGATIGPAPKIQVPPPQTFVPVADPIVSQDELEALAEPTPVGRDEIEANWSSDEAGDHDELDLPEFDPAMANNPLVGKSYAQVRRHTAKLRIPPPQFQN